MVIWHSQAITVLSRWYGGSDVPIKDGMQDLFISNVLHRQMRVSGKASIRKQYLIHIDARV